MPGRSASGGGRLSPETVDRLGLLAGLAAVVAALLLTPPPGATAAAGYQGLPRLVLYALAGTALSLTARRCAPAFPGWAVPGTRWRLLGGGLAASLVLAGLAAARLRTDATDLLAPGLWLAALIVLLGVVLATARPEAGWRSAAGRPRLLGLAAVVGLLLVAAALRVPGLADIPRGIEADEGDRAGSAFDVLAGQASAAWFDSGWFYISLVYFRLLAATMALFGADVGGGRMLNALLGVAFVGAVAWVGYRTAGWRVGLVAAVLAAGSGLALQNGRLISETGPTVLLWTLSLAGFLEGAFRGRAWGFVIAGLAGGLSLYFYPSARLWAVGATLTMVVLVLAAPRQRRVGLVLGGVMAALASLVAAAPFLEHLARHPTEATLRFAQTTALDPVNQSRLSYLSPPEPLPALGALQVERALGLFDRYADAGGFYPTGQPVFPPPLAALALVGVFFTLVGARRDPRLALLGAWFWLGLSGVFLTVETPNAIRATMVLPVLFPIMAVVLVDLTDRLLGLGATVRPSPAWSRLALVLPVSLGLVAAGTQTATYFQTFRTLPARWAPATNEGLLVAALGASGPVYSVEGQEHLVASGWVRLLAPNAVRGRLPNPGRELPVVGTGIAAQAPDPRWPRVVPRPGESLSFVFSGDANQDAYLDLVQRLYPGGVLVTGSDGRRGYQVSPDALAATRGVTVVGARLGERAVSRFGEVPADAVLPDTLTWRAGVFFPRPGRYQFALGGPGAPRLSIDDVPVGQAATLAPGLHFLQVQAEIAAADAAPSLRYAEPTDGPRSSPEREFPPEETYRLMDAPWGLLARVEGPAPAAAPSPPTFVDATVAMAFLAPEIRLPGDRGTIAWSGILRAPRAGTYRMAFASDDPLHFEVDGQPVDVPVVSPEAWARVGAGGLVPLSAGEHRVRIVLEVTHGGREVARWSWVPPAPGGSADLAAPWTIVPPSALRPDPSVDSVP